MQDLQQLSEEIQCAVNAIQIACDTNDTALSNRYQAIAKSYCLNALREMKRLQGDGYIPHFTPDLIDG